MVYNFADDHFCCLTAFSVHRLRWAVIRQTGNWQSR